MASGFVIRIERVVTAPRVAVYTALTTPDQLREWWGPIGFSAPSVEFDPRVGGGYCIAMQPPDGDRFHLTGTFRDVRAPIHLAYTFCWIPPDPDDRETLATLSLEQVDRGTEVLLTHAGFATEERRALHEQGWNDSLARLSALLGDAQTATSSTR